MEYHDVNFMDFNEHRNMAEAAVENPPPSRYFCHRCENEISPLLPDYICPQCQLGFIEELIQNTPDNGDDSEDDAFFHDGTESDDMLGQVSDLWNLLSYMRGDNYIARGQSENRGGGARLGPLRRTRIHRPTRRNADPQAPSGRTDGFLQHLMTSLTDTGLVVNVPNVHNVILDLHSNPGDYAWGRGGWNAIITQLINQLDGTGPPPLPREKIDEIPYVNIASEQVDKNLQCTVCMEDFELNERVRRLACDHHYHNGCIVPWLELHGTCPICRKLLNEHPSQENLPSTSSNETNRPAPNSQQSIYDFTDDFD